MRLFIAIDPPEPVRHQLAALQQDMEALLPEVRWVSPANLHLTLKFIGEANDSEIVPLSRELADIKAASPIRLKFCGLGHFPTSGEIHVVVAHLADHRALNDLVVQIDAACRKAHLPGREQGFRAHISIGRPRSRLTAADWKRLDLDRIAAQHSFEFAAEEFVLYQSVLGKRESQYFPLQRFSL